MSELDAPAMEWVLDGHKPRLASSWDEVVAFFRLGPEARRVAEDTIGAAWVSTVFLTVDHGFGRGAPVLFETMVFGGDHDGEQWRYRSWDDAEAGHRAVVDALRSGLPLPGYLPGWLPASPDQPVSVLGDAT